MSLNVTINDGAILIADAHYSDKNPYFLDFLKMLDSKKIECKQLILLGDIFDLLFFEIKPTVEKNIVLIDLLNRLSQSIEVVFFEGNHDYNLKMLFPKIEVITLKNQPLLTTYHDKKIYLAHGDWGSNFSYRLYSIIIRNSFVLKMLNILNNILSNSIINKLEAYLAAKDDCKEFYGFENYISERFKRVELKRFDYFVEGHFHQNRDIKFKNHIYINIGSFACNQRYFVVKSTEELLEEIELIK